MLAEQNKTMLSSRLAKGGISNRNTLSWLVR